ncbi:hypothetical protein F7725_023081 [Dissostichus mawsoni]|uniref:Uncharacterized protein n=1 Tax=Dissostichus mawsoni TaxID=36200 RepID=A0A7J5Z031_DISMA|nr:hypothetical protein F7725_023081 [Dissostichus mawsoni]
MCLKMSGSRSKKYSFVSSWKKKSLSVLPSKVSGGSPRLKLGPTHVEDDESVLALFLLLRGDRHRGARHGHPSYGRRSGEREPRRYTCCHAGLHLIQNSDPRKRTLQPDDRGKTEEYRRINKLNKRSSSFSAESGQPSKRDLFLSPSLSLFFSSARQRCSVACVFLPLQLLLNKLLFLSSTAIPPSPLLTTKLRLWREERKSYAERGVVLSAPRNSSAAPLGETNQCVMVKEAASPEAQFQPFLFFSTTESSKAFNIFLVSRLQFLEMFYSVFTQLYHFSRSAQHRGVQSHDLQPVNSIHAQPLVPSGSMWDGQNDTLKVLICFMNTVHSKKFQANNRTSDFVRSGCVSRSMIVRNKYGGQERFSSYFLGGTSPCWRWFY